MTEAQLLAHWLERDGANCQQHIEAAAELRRLEAELEQERIDYKAKCAELEVAWAERDKLAASNKMLVDALNWIATVNATGQAHQTKARAALAQYGGAA